VSLNVNAPLYEDSWGSAWNVNGGGPPLNKWVDVTGRTQGSVSIKRGRQYELDAMQAGEYSTTLDNSDGALDPLNPSGPWFGNVEPFQPFRRRLMWGASPNLLPQQIASCGSGWATGYNPTNSDIGVVSGTDSTGGTVQMLGAGNVPNGTTAFQFAVPAATAGNTNVVTYDHLSVRAGMPYAFQIYVRNVTASTTANVAACMGFYTNGSATVTSWAAGDVAALVGSTSAGWTQIRAWGTAPANATGVLVGLSLTVAATTSATELQVNSWQLEQNSTSTAWVWPGNWYPIFNGYVERWPTTWDSGGLRGTVKPEAVDAFALLSQYTLADPLTEELNLLNPRFVYRLDDPVGATSAADSTGNNPAANFGTSKAGSGAYAFGTSITATNTATGEFAGPGTVMTLTNPSPGVSWTTTPVATSFLSLSSAGITGPANPAEWTRVIAFRWGSGALGSGNLAKLASAYDQYNNGFAPSGANIEVQIEDTGAYLAIGAQYAPYQLSMAFSGSASATPTDGNWHLLVYGMSTTSTEIMASFDGKTASAYTSYTSGYINYGVPNGIVCDSVGAMVVSSLGNMTDFNYTGDIAFVAEIPTLLTATQITNLYTAWRNAASGESSGARYARILRYAGFTGPTWLDAGNTTSMGPATDLSGSDAMSALEAVVTTESGSHVVRGTGTLRFMSRGFRYNSNVPYCTFGDGPGELPYEDLQLDYDTTHLASQVQVTQNSSSQIFTANSTSSATNYFARLMQRTINTDSTLECQDAANYLLSRYQSAAVRITSLKLNLAGNPLLWGTVVNLEIGTRIRVMRQPPGYAAPMQLDCFIESMQWDFSDKGAATLTMQCSPADLTPYGVMTSWRAWLKSPALAGATSLTITPINPVTQAALDVTNPLAAQVGIGQQLLLDHGLPTQETVTVTAVGATSANWTTGTLQVTSTTQAHAVSAALCEPLPYATTVTTFDPSAAFNSSAFSY